MKPEATRDSALLLIDMQQGMADPRAGQRNNPQAEANMLRLLNAWRQAGGTVVHVRHISRSATSLFAPGQPGSAFQPALAPLDTEHVTEKNVPDAFAASGLERWLRTRGLERVVIAGVSTNNSVEATARSAGNLGFNVHVVADACFTFDLVSHDGQRAWPAAEVHAMALANMALDYAEIVDAEHLLHPQGH